MGSNDSEASDHRSREGNEEKNSEDYDSYTGSEDEDSSSDNDSERETDGDDHVMPGGSNPKSQATSTSRTQSFEEDSRAMLQDLKAASSADLEKGKDVKKQLVCSA